MNFTTILRSLSHILGVLVAICYFYQIVYLILPLIKKQRPHSREKLHRYAILIAARNEEAVLPHLLRSIAGQDYPAELITTYVVADNCTDRTAEVARAAGARVYSRFNQKEVGKGYALNFLWSRSIRTTGCIPLMPFSSSTRTICSCRIT